MSRSIPLRIDEVPQLLIDRLPKRAYQIEQIVEANTTDSGELLYYPILSQVLSAVIQDEQRRSFSDRTELGQISELAELALNIGDDRIAALFVLEFLEAFALGPFTTVPVRDLLGARGKVHYDDILAARSRTAGL
jgi:hypothetical protein